MRKLLLIVALATTLQASEIMSIVKECVDEKAQLPEKSCVSIALPHSINQPTDSLTMYTFYLCATACENPQRYYENVGK